MDYFVSGHGGLPVPATTTTQVPAGYNFVLFCHRNNVLPDSEAWPIYDHLLIGDTAWAAGKIKQRFYEHATMPDYVCWNYPEIKLASDVFTVGLSKTEPGKPIISLAPYSAAKPLAVSDLFKMLPAAAKGTTTTLYWVACTN